MFESEYVILSGVALSLHDSSVSDDLCLSSLVSHIINQRADRWRCLLPPMDSDLNVISGGSTGLVKLCADRQFVEKVPYSDTDDDSLEDLQREYAAYKRLPRHPRLLQLHPDSTPKKLVLQYLHRGCLHDFLRPSPYPSSPGSLSPASPPYISSWQRIQFAADAAESLDILHGVSIVHGDINTWNFLITDEFRHEEVGHEVSRHEESQPSDLRLCIIDFSGSTIDAVRGSAIEGFRYWLPRAFRAPSTVRTDVFALGSLLYEIATSEEPYKTHADDEAVEHFRQGIFPPTKDVLLGNVIRACWQGEYDSARSVYEDIQEQQRRLLR
jgi:serine/threonine protein kinase